MNRAHSRRWAGRASAYWTNVTRPGGGGWAPRLLDARAPVPRSRRGGFMGAITCIKMTFISRVASVNRLTKDGCDTRPFVLARAGNLRLFVSSLR